MNRKEIWKDIDGYAGLYQVSNLGRVKRLAKPVFTSNGHYRIFRERFLKPFLSRNKKLYFVELCKGGETKKLLLHRVVVESFIRKLHNKEIVTHKDNNGFNNNVCNLEITDNAKNWQKRKLLLIAENTKNAANEIIGEIWRDVVGYEGLYLISNMGRVRSLITNGWTKGKNGILSPGTTRKGYSMVVLSKEGKPTSKAIHRLVAEAFIPNPLNLPQINHKDENKKNNKVENLEWCDAKYNTNYGGRCERCRIAMKKVWAEKKGKSN